MKIMENQIENPQAFPSKILDYSESSIQQRTVYEGQNEGMTLRDYFASKVINGIIASDPNVNGRPWNLNQDCDNLAKGAYKIADAMLKERSK